MEQILELITDEEYRAFLREQPLSALTYSQILRRARIPLQEKVPLMQELFAAADTSDVKEIAQLARELHELEDAVKQMEEDNPAACYELNHYWLQDYTPNRPYNRYYQHFTFYDCQVASELFHTIKQAKHALVGFHLFSEDVPPHAGIIKRKAPYKSELYYAISDRGIIWGYSRWRHIWDDDNILVPSPIPSLELSHPYQPGDIVTIDMQPFLPLRHFLILKIEKGRRKQFWTRGYYLDNSGSLCYDILETIAEDCDLLTPYLHLGRCKELPDSEKLLEEMAGYIRKAPALASIFEEARLGREENPSAAMQKIAERYFEEHPNVS